MVGVGSTPYYKRGQSLPQTPLELAGKAVARGRRRRRALDLRRRRARALQHGPRRRHVAVRPGAGHPRGAVHRDADRWRRGRGRLGRARGRGHRLRPGRVRREPHDPATGAQPIRRVVRTAGHPGRAVLRAAVARGQLHPAVGPDGSGPDVRGDRQPPHAPVRHEARALRRGRDLDARQRHHARDVDHADATHARRLLQRADDRGAVLPLRLLPRVRRRGRGRHDVGRTGRGSPSSTRVRHGDRARRPRALGAGDHLDGHAGGRVRVVGPPSGRASGCGRWRG